MTRTMTPEEFNQWSRLPHAVVRRCFWWAYHHDHKGARQWYAIDYEDMVAEGNLALMDAWSLYDQERDRGKGKRGKSRPATFKTYAYRSIFNRVSRFVDANMSQLTTREWRRAKGGNPEEDARIAGSCVSFADLLSCGAQNHFIDRTMPEPGEEITKNEWIETCMGELREKLGKRKTAILLRWARGDNLKSIGRTLRVTREWARILINEWLVQASAILADREDDSFDK